MVAQAFGVSAGLTPKEGPKALPYTFDMTETTVLEASFGIIDSGMSMVQSIFIDNSRNEMAAVISCSITNQNIAVLPLTQIFLPFICAASTFINITCVTAGAVIVPVQLLNYAVFPVSYAAAAQSVTISGTPDVSIPGTVLVQQSSTPWPVSLASLPQVVLKPPANQALNLSGNTLIKTGAGVLRGMAATSPGVSSPGMLYDGTSALGTPLYQVPNSNVLWGDLNMTFDTGLYYVPAGGQQLSVWYD